MGTTAVALTLLAAAIAQSPGRRSQPTGGRIQKQEIDYQKEAFQQWWETDFVTKLDDLPTPVSYTHLTLPTIYSV